MKHYVITSDDVSARGAADDCAVQLRKYASLGAGDHRRWAELSDRAGAANVFAQHWFMDAALRHSAPAGDAVLAVVLDHEGAWLGAVPLVPEPSFGRWPVRNWQTWLATNQFLGTPLVSPRDAHRFWRSLLRYLDAHTEQGVLLHCRRFAQDDPVCAALADCCDAEGRAFRVLERFERPARFPGSAIRPASKSEKKALARLRSLRGRLERDHGPVTVTIEEPDACCEHWIDTFLALERKGWKGRTGSALACSPDTEALFREVIRGGQERRVVRLATLAANGRPLAMSSWFEAGDRGLGFKMAFDEAFRSYAPGQLLMRSVADWVGRNPAMHFDTCTPALRGQRNSPWNDDQTIYDCAVAIGPRRYRLLFDGLMRARTAWATVMPAIRRMAKTGPAG